MRRAHRARGLGRGTFTTEYHRYSELWVIARSLPESETSHGQQVPAKKGEKENKDWNRKLQRESRGR